MNNKWHQISLFCPDRTESTQYRFPSLVLLTAINFKIQDPCVVHTLCIHIGLEEVVWMYYVEYITLILFF